MNKEEKEKVIEIVIATKNKGKILEIINFFQDIRIEDKQFLDLYNFGLSKNKNKNKNKDQNLSEKKLLKIKDNIAKLKNINWLTFENFSNFPDVIEGEKSFLENAVLKAKTVSEFTKRLTLADDSGLEVDILDGEPGVISSVYAGDNATDEENRIKLLEKLKPYKNIEDRKARFICYMVLYDPLKGILNISDGVCEGAIGFEEKGMGGFGYDPIFIPDGYFCTMAELDTNEKNKISHRAKALTKTAIYLSSFLV